MLLYRHEIDGLRAVAVLSVTLYHAGFSKFFPGGYVGVDVFFVISGYLITSLIKMELEDRTFSIIKFYERRCRRILPALYVLLFPCSYFAYHAMVPKQLKDFAYCLLSIVTFSSNIFFWWTDDGYFSQINELKPLIHTWSLAVEEQFYIVFPFLCYLYWSKRSYLLGLLAFCGLLSFFLAQWGCNLQLISIGKFHMFCQHSWASFYMPTGRIWELMIGSFVAFYLDRKDLNTAPVNMRGQCAALLGLSLIIVSILFFDSRSIPQFPNCFTLVPTFGTALVIIFGNQRTLIGRLLSTFPMRWIGLISYSAYLWHQPLLVLFRLRSQETGNTPNVYTAIIIAYILATVTYFLVERPFRNRTLISRKQIFSIATMGAMAVILTAWFLIHTAEIRAATVKNTNNESTSTTTLKTLVQGNLSTTLSQKMGRNQSNNSLPNTVDGDRSEMLRNLVAVHGPSILESIDPEYVRDVNPYDLSTYTTQAFDSLMRSQPTFSNNSSAKNRRILLVGDSFAQDFLNMALITKSLTSYEVRVYCVRVQCQIYMGPEDRLQWVDPRHRQLCINQEDIKFALPLIRQADIIILAACWFEWSAVRLPRTVQLLNLTKSQRLFVIGPKNFGKLDWRWFFNKTLQYRLQLWNPPEEDAAKVNAILKKAFDPSVYVDIISMTCIGHNGTCPAFTREGKLITYDSGHVTKYGSLYVGSIIFKRFPLTLL